jgi:hypothetical protein
MFMFSKVSVISTGALPEAITSKISCNLNFSISTTISLETLPVPFHYTRSQPDQN